MVYSDRSELDIYDETIIIQNFPLSRKLWRTNCWKLLTLLPFRKAHSFRTIKDVDRKLTIIAQIISLIIVSMNLFFYLSYVYCHKIKVLSFHLSAFGISCQNMLARLSDWIFNPMRYCGIYYEWVDN